MVKGIQMTILELKLLNNRNRIFSTHLLLSLLLPPDVRVDALSDGELARSLADLRQVSAGEALKNISS